MYGFLCGLSYFLSVYDCFNNLIFEGITDKYGYASIDLDKDDIYKIIVKTPKKMGLKKCVIFYFRKCGCNKLSIIFNKNICPITIKLTDKYYKNLPISGRMILRETNKQFL